MLFLAPLRGATQIRAARSLGLDKADFMFTLRVEGPDKPGLGNVITSELAEAGISLHGFSGASLGRRAAIYIAFDTREDASRGLRLLRRILPT